MGAFRTCLNRTFGSAQQLAHTTHSVQDVGRMPFDLFDASSAFCVASSYLQHPFVAQFSVFAAQLYRFSLLVSSYHKNRHANTPETKQK